MTPKRTLAEPNAQPAQSQEKAKREAIKRMGEALERALKRALLNKAMEERSIAVSREAVRNLSIEGITAEDASVLLATKALGLMQTMRKNERVEFLADATGKIEAMLNTHEIPVLFADTCEGAGPLDREVNAATTLRDFSSLAEQMYRQYHRVCDDDASPKNSDADYYTTHWIPISKRELHTGVISVRVADLSIEPEKKLEYLEGEALSYSDERRLELFNAMLEVWQKAADMMGQGFKVATKIRRNAVDLTDRHFRQEGAGPKEREGSMLYHEAVELHGKLEPCARQVEKIFIKDGLLPEMVKKIGEKFSLKVQLESQTSDPDEVCTIKGPAGMFRKVLRKRAHGNPDYGVGDIQDICRTTVVVYGSLKEARTVADWIRIGLTHNMARFRIDRIAIKDEKRESGYEAAHVVFEIKIDGKAVPCEIQVRTKEMHEDAKMGKFSHGLKEAGITTEEQRAIMDRVLAFFREWFRRSEIMNQTQKLEKKKIGMELDRKSQTYRINIMDMRGGMPKSSHISVRAEKDEAVGGVVALAGLLGVKTKVEGAGKEKLDLFDKCPEEIVITLEKGQGVGRSTCEKLMGGAVVTPAAIEKIREYMKTIPKRGLFRKD